MHVGARQHHGTSLAIWLVADPAKQPQIGWSRSSTYPNQEGAFFGNIFVSPPRANYCAGRNMHASVIADRIGAGTPGAPYVDPWGSEGKCQDHCADDGTSMQSGYESCNGSNAVLTVWRKASY